MNMFQRRRLKKLTRQVLHEASHARNMREDRAKPADIEALNQAEQAVHGAWNSNDIENIHTHLENLSAAAACVYPQRQYSQIRENVEIFAVAIVIAMGFRSYFIQPFKIPTGSMQPTMYGIQVDQNSEPNWTDKIPFRYVKFILTGKRYVAVRAKSSGYVGFFEDKTRHKSFLLVNETRPSNTVGKRHKVEPKMKWLVEPRQFVKKGEVMAKGMITSGDHIFVDKMRYNFSKAKRGQIVVFRTEHISYRGISPRDHYIKRLVGLPGEKVSVEPPYLVVDGQRIEEPYAFDRLLNDKEHGYIGYTLANPGDPKAKLRKRADVVELDMDEFLPFGDNTENSLDGRYFGSVKMGSMIGPAFAVYWPFNPRWGWVR